ncbi:MAG: type IX secretion system membrane protein PorP/SprF [Imperialibacter sp.]|uniref:PorP/SprF family type IX secretion system membrane protein n=1 Tax=Imperialibacter sp. TaxID=2038411 RepID=UPI003A8478C2
MMGNKSSFIVVLIFFYSLAAEAQDFQYSQYYSAPLYLNPAFAGTEEHQRITVNNRIQWPSLPKAFNNYSLSYDYNMKNLNSGVGLLLSTEQAGSAGLRNTSGAINYSYKVNFNKKWVVSTGIYLGYTSRRIDPTKIIFGDQIDFGVDGVPSSDPVASQITPVQYLDTGAGILMYNQRVWLGAGFHHLNQPNQSFLEGSSKLPMKYSIHGGIQIPLGNKTFQRGEAPSSISPSFVFKSQGTFQQLDVGASFLYEPIIFGLWYRGIPFADNGTSFINHDAVVLLMGVRFLAFDVGYSYDASISRLGADTGGAHEISIQYRFDTTNPAKVKRKDKFLPCPSFYGKASKK